MSSKRIKKPIRRKKKSDYPGEMSFRKALGMNPVYMQTGGDKDNNMDGMMKARIAYAVMHGNPSAKRMVIPTDNPYIFQGTEPYTTPDIKGEPGTHYMFSEGNYAIPTIQQDSLDNLFYNVNAGPTDKEAIRFERPEDAEYFAKNYKSVAPAFRKTYQKGGKLYYQEDNSFLPSKFIPQMFQPNPLTGKYNWETPKVQTENPIEVKYGTPEYERAYNQGTLVTRLSGDPEDAPLSAGRMLPEVPFEAFRESGQNVFENYPYFNTLTEEEKKYFRDTSPIGRNVRRVAKRGREGFTDEINQFLIGATKMAMMPFQVPQSAIVEGVEALRGNDASLKRIFDPNLQRVPSDVWGLENKPGFGWEDVANFSLNMGIDPLNLAGAGLLKNPIKAILRETLDPTGLFRMTGRGLKLAAKRIKKPITNLSSQERKNLEKLRRVFHNSERFLSRSEVELLGKYGFGKRSKYRNADLIDNNENYNQFTEANNSRVTNWLDENTLNSSNFQINNLNQRLAQDTPEELRRAAKQMLQYRSPDVSNVNSLQSAEEALINWSNQNRLEIPTFPRGSFQHIFDRYNIPTDVRDVDDAASLLNSSQKSQFLRDILSEVPRLMSTEDLYRARIDYNNSFNNTASTSTASSKPVVKNKSGLTKEETLLVAGDKDKDVISKMSEEEFENTVLKPNGEIVPYYQGSLEPQFSGSQNVVPLSQKEYTDEFNSKLDLLNDIIAQKNRSGVEYRVKGLDENGRLIFYTPEQTIKHGDVNVTIPSGQSSWGVRLNPGQWRGNVDDIANTTYYKSIPGLEMTDTRRGVFADNIPRRGTGAYEAINEYLKRLDLGRLKPGFNSQTTFSRGAWENFIKSGRAVGFYNDPRTVYGIMKTILSPIAIGSAIYGVDQMQDSQPTMRRQGGKLYYQENAGQLPTKYVVSKTDPAFIAYKDSFDLAKLSQIQQEREGFNRFISLSSIGDEAQKHAAKERSNKGVNPSTPYMYDKNNDDYNYYEDKLSSLNNPRIFLSPRSSSEFYHSSIFPTKGIISKKGPLNAYYPFPKQRVLVKPNEGITRNIHQYQFRNPISGETEDRVSLITPWHQYIMNMHQYGKLLPTDSIPQQGNFLYRTNYRELGGKLYYQEDVGPLPTLYVDPNDPEGVFRYEAYQDSSSLYKKGNRNYLTSMSYGPAGLQRPYWRKTRIVDLPPGYIVPNQTNQPIGRKITEASFPSLVNPVTKERFGKEYFRKILDIYAEPRQPVKYLSKSNNTSTVNKPSNSVSAPVRNFRETISQIPYKNPMTGETETRVVLTTPNDEFIMTLEQYGKLGTDSIPKEGNYIFKRRAYARGGSLTSAQDTAQAVDLNKDVARKDTKKASAFEDFMAFNFGVGAGFLDTISFGATNELTDAGFKALQSAAGHDVNSEEAKRQAGLKGWGNIGGAVGGAFLNPGAMGSAIEEGMEGLGQGIKGIDPNSPTATGIGTALEGISNTKAFKGLNDKDKIPEGMEGFSKIFMARNGGRFRYGYQGGGHMLNQNMGLTEIDGPSHEEGGVTLPNNGGRPDVEVEGPETIYTPENYVMSEKMKASLEALEFAGITGKAAKRLAGKSYADLSKMIKSKAGDKLRPNDPLSKKMLDKEMKKLMMAHEYDREAKRMQDEAMRSQMMGGSNIIAETPEERAGGYNMYPNAQSIAFPGSGPTSVVPTYNNDPIMVTGADGSQQMLTDEPIETQAPFIEEKMAQGGKMIKRADGSYSRRGLWDNIRKKAAENKRTGKTPKKPTDKMLWEEKRIQAEESKAMGGMLEYGNGGGINNPGFRALPDYVQAKIKSNMEVGGYMGDYIGDDDTMEYGEGGYTVRRSNDRKGKTHVVIGPDGTKKYFGDPKLGERGKSKYGKDAFYARHKKNLAKNPYFRAYARATWEDGGYMDMLNANVDIPDMEAPMYAYGGPMMYAQGGIHTMRKKANFARNFAKEYGGYYQMGGEMMQAPQQGQPQGGGGEEQILQQVAQMLQQGMSPEEIVGQLVQMGVPQEQAIQVVQMVVQQMQGQQQAPQQAPPMMRGGGYMYQMGGEMAPQQQAQGGEEQIVQAIMQMLQQGMQPEEIVAQLVQMGLPQEAAIQAVQMVMQQSQQGQQQQMPAQAPAPMMRYGGRVTKQMGGSLADNYLSQVNQYPVLKRNGGKLYYQQDEGYLDNTTKTLENMINDDSIESGIYEGPDAIAIGNQANANAARANSLVNSSNIRPIRINRPSLVEQATYLGGVNPQGIMPSVSRSFNPNYSMTPDERKNWLNKTKGYSGLLPDEGYEAIDMFENTMGTYDSKGNPTSMNMPEGYSKTGGSRPEAVTETEKYINNTIGIDTWNSLPDDIKTLWYDASFNSTDNKEYFLRALAQAVQDSDPNFQYPQNIGYTDNDYKNYRNNLSDQQALEIIRNADFTKNDVTGNFINILNQQRKSIGTRSKFPENYMPTFNRRAIDVYNNFQNLNSNQSSNPQPGNTTSAAPTVVSQATAAPSNNQSNLKIGILDKPINTPAGNFQRINPEVYIPGAYTPPTSIGFNAKPPVNMMQPPSVKNNYRRDPSLFKIPLGTPSASTPANDTEPSPPEYKSPMGNYIAGGVGSMFGPLANIAAAAFAPDPTYTAAPKFKKFDYTPVALQRAAGNQAMANTRQAIRMGAPTQGSYLANVGVSMPSAGAQIGSQVAQTRYGIDSQNIGLMNQEAQLRAAQAEKNALMKDQSISNRWKLGMEAAAGVGRNIQGFSKDMGAKEMQDQLLNQLRTGDFAIIGYDNVNGTLVPKLAPAGVATYNDGTITLSNGQRARRNPDTGKYEIIPQ